MRLTGLILAAALSACAHAFAIQGGDANVAQDVVTGRQRIEAFFGEPFTARVNVVVAPDRAAFDRRLPAAWGIAPSQCWMVVFFCFLHLLGHMTRATIPAMQEKCRASSRTNSRTHFTANTIQRETSPAWMMSVGS